ncbi:MAG: DNA polymerase III subunit gamma/tau [Alphaproteobacteria bacterium]|nr:DNA polymerase III subunit gamma/tau [Alphaproteobacteria bacterium]OJV47136.1 MAG: DNA polymerase III, subunit gamma and tau [Alphaproteobacteria bacterium 43-37]
MLFSEANQTASSYKVLARAYRPETFEDLIGQEQLVSSLKQALSNGRLPHAFIFSGIRGVGKTTTARILARCLNCETGPTITPCGHCGSCVAIKEDRHLDVIEIDAASRTGVDDMRELIEAGRYKAVSGRYKIFIIDEVHMLSKSAFNALLKTLEEPPPHLIFIFATTETDKIPTTILSRCTRCELKRIDNNTLAKHFADIATRENATISDEAAQIIARASDGSVRDGLSLLDQAITTSDKNVDAQTVNTMLGLMDKATILPFIEQILIADTKQALTLALGFYKNGANPQKIVEDSLEAIHALATFQFGESEEELPSYVISARNDIEHLAKRSNTPQLLAIWEHLILALTEIELSPSPLLALEMAIIRLCQTLKEQQLTSSSPNTPGEDQRKPQGPTQQISTTIAPVTAVSIASPIQDDPVETITVLPKTMEEILNLLIEHKEVLLAEQVRRDIRPIHLNGTTLQIALHTNADNKLGQNLSKALAHITGDSWIIDVQTQSVNPTLLEAQKMQDEALHAKLLSHPLTQSAMEIFPGSDVRTLLKH